MIRRHQHAVLQPNTCCSDRSGVQSRMHPRGERTPDRTVRGQSGMLYLCPAHVSLCEFIALHAASCWMLSACDRAEKRLPASTCRIKWPGCVLMSGAVAAAVSARLYVLAWLVCSSSHDSQCHTCQWRQLAGDSRCGDRLYRLLSSWLQHR
jgi:hypothetical protein